MSAKHALKGQKHCISFNCTRQNRSKLLLTRHAASLHALVCKIFDFQTFAPTGRNLNITLTQGDALGCLLVGLSGRFFTGHQCKWRVEHLHLHVGTRRAAFKRWKGKKVKKVKKFCTNFVHVWCTVRTCMMYNSYIMHVQNWYVRNNKQFKFLKHLPTKLYSNIFCISLTYFINFSRSRKENNSFSSR